MLASTVSQTTDTHVGMGQIGFAGPEGSFCAVLGSCLGVALYYPPLRLGAFAHVVLPESTGRSGPPGKFADTAIPHMLEQLRPRGANPAGLVAKIAGGACMFGAGGPLQIGDANAAMVIQLLNNAGIRIAGKHLGGTKGRRVVFECSTGVLLVQIAGQEPVAI